MRSTYSTALAASTIGQHCLVFALGTTMPDSDEKKVQGERGKNNIFLVSLLIALLLIVALWPWRG